MTKECKGLPLALITVGSAMAGVNDVEAWREAKSDLRNSAWTASDMEKNVFSILKFSYDRLPDEAHKSCFLYCALYPEDYEIEVNKIVDRWIGEGFIGKDKSIASIYDQGKSIITKLKLSCLSEDVEDLLSTIYTDCQAIKMHDVIRDMALWISRDEDRKKDKVVVEGEALSMSKWDSERLNDVERISIINFKGSWQVPPCPNLLTLSVSKYTKITDYSNLLCMTNIKVLDLSFHDRCFPEWSDLLIQISKLMNLEFLKMIEVPIPKRLPMELKSLKNLRVFHINSRKGIIPMEVIESLERCKVFRLYCGYMEDKRIVRDDYFVEARACSFKQVGMVA